MEINIQSKIQSEPLRRSVRFSLLVAVAVVAVAVFSGDFLRTVHSKNNQRSPGSDLREEDVSPYVFAVDGESFAIKQSGKSIETLPLKTSLRVFKAFGLTADSRSLLFTALKNGVPSGELYVEDLQTGDLRRISSDVVLEAAWSPGNDNVVAYTFSSGASFGLAVVEIDSGNVNVLCADSVMADVIQWDRSGQGIHYFRATTEYSYTELSPRYISTNKKLSKKTSAPPRSFPVLKKKARPKMLSQASGKRELTHPPDLYSFQVLSPDGQHEVSGENLLGSGALFARTGSSASVRVGEGKLLKVLNNGVVVKNFTAGGSKVEFVDWNGRTINIGTASLVNYNLPMASPTVTQGGIGYSAPGSCNLVSHVGSPHSFAYDLEGATVGDHILASADGLVVLTVSTVTCNSLDTQGCTDYVPNCNQGTYLGNVVVIQHADGSYTNYAHMDKFSVQVEVGTNACQGLQVGRQGHTGSTDGTHHGCGDHLHFQRQSSPDIFGESVAVTFSDVASNPLACGSNLVSGSTESSYSVSPTSQSFSSSAAQGTIDVISTGSATCAWTAASNDGFITIISGGIGSGSGSVGYTVADNPNTTLRTGTMLIAGKAVTIKQYGVGYVNEPPTVNAGTDQALTLPGGANLSGTATDDGLPNPPGAMTTTWSMVSGPGIVTFGNANALSTTASFSVSGQYVLRLTADDSDLSSPDNVVVTINSASTTGALSVSSGTPAAAINLTTEGTADWAHWGLATATSFNHKSGVTQLINMVKIGNSNVEGYNENPNSYSWTDGTPTSARSNVTTGVFVFGVNNGFQVTVPADTNARTLRLYVGLWSAQGKLEASLSDGSAPPFIDTSLVDQTDTTNRVYILNYQALSAGQTLTVKWTANATFSNWGNVTLQAASLVSTGSSNHAPIVNAGSDQTITLPGTAALSGTATDDGLPNPPGAMTTTWSMVSGPGIVTFGNANALSTTASFSVSGQYVLRLTADDSDLSSPDNVVVTINSASTTGALSVSSGTPAAAINLTTEGTADWAHWGLATATSFNHKSGVTQLINMVKIGNSNVEGYNENPNSYSWTDGTPTSARSNVTTGVFVFGVNNGFQVTVPADTNARTLRLYVGLWSAQGKLEASLSDGSAPPFIDTSLVDQTDTTNRVYILNYQALSAGQTLTVRWTANATFSNWGNVTLQAASSQ